MLLESRVLDPSFLTPPAAGWGQKCEQFDGFRHLQGELRKQGLAVTRFRAPVRMAVVGVDSRPLMTVDAFDRPVVLSERVGDSIRLEDVDGGSQWMNVSEVAQRLGIDESSEHEWLAPEELQPKLKGTSPWRLVVELLRPETSDIVVICIYAVAVGLLSLALPIAVQVLVNTVAFGTLVQPIIVLSALLGLGLAFASALRALQAWVVELVQRRVFVRLVSALAERLPRVHVSAFERAHGPELVNRFFDVFTAQKAVASMLFGGIEATLTVLVGLVVLAFYHPILLTLGIVILSGVAFIVLVLGRGGTPTTVAESKAKYAVAGWLEEMARHLFTLKITGGADFARARLDALSSSWLDTRARHFRVVYRQMIGALALQVVTSVALLAIGGWLVVNRELTVGQLVAAELIVTAVVASLNKLGGKLESAYDLAAAAEKLAVLLDLPMERAGGEQPAQHEIAVELTDVGQSGLVSIDSLTVRRGERVSVVGSGMQRRILSELLFGMRDPDSGVVRVDGHDVRAVDLDALRARLAVVRDPEILPGTVADNVRVARRDLSSQRMWELLELVGLGDTIRALPQGLHTKLTPDGSPLMRDAALRLTLARALASKATTLVLDGVLDELRFGDARRRELSHGRTVLALGEVASEFCERTIDLAGGNR